MKRKRRPRHLLLVCCIALVLLMALLARREDYPKATCQGVNPQAVDSPLDKGATVVECLEMGR